MPVSLECDFRTEGQLLESVVERSDLFFKQYRWAVSWYQPEISALRDGLDPAKISKILASRRYWEKTRWDNHGMMAKTMKPSFQSRITAPVEREVKAVAEYLRSVTAEYKMVLNPNHITIYTNEYGLARDAADMARYTKTLGTVRLKTVNVSLPPETVILKRPYAYGYRTWFRSKIVDPKQQQVLKDWIKNMGPEVHACPSLQRWLSGKNAKWGRSDYCLDHYFVDHNDPKLDVWMAMVCPSIVRKTQAIQSPAK